MRRVPALLQPLYRLYRWCGCNMETEQFCCIAEGFDSRHGSQVTESGLNINLGACKLRSQKYCLRQHGPIC
jgi:hypothetical protein